MIEAPDVNRMMQEDMVQTRVCPDCKTSVPPGKSGIYMRPRERIMVRGLCGFCLDKRLKGENHGKAN